MNIDPIAHDRILLVDFGLYMHKAIFATVNNPSIPATYTCMNMIIADLKKIDYYKHDLVIVAVDGRGNWRKDLDPQYKANRKQLRDASEIDWTYWYEQFNQLLEKLKSSTPFHYIKLDKCEADDIIAVACKTFKDNPCVVMSADSDFEQLASYPNVKIFSPYTKKYKVIDNPFKVLQSKIKKEKTDNLVSEVLDEISFKRRTSLVSLLHLPDYIEAKVLDSLNQMCYNVFNINNMPFKSLRSKLYGLYSKEEVRKEVVLKPKRKRSVSTGKRKRVKGSVSRNEEIF
jgi:5'-3' exonuclease